MFIIDYLCFWFVFFSHYDFRNKIGHCKISSLFWRPWYYSFSPWTHGPPLFFYVPLTHFYFSIQLFCIPFLLVPQKGASCLLGIYNWRDIFKDPFPWGTWLYGHAKLCLSRIETRRKICYEKALFHIHRNALWFICASLTSSVQITENWLHQLSCRLSSLSHSLHRHFEIICLIYFFTGICGN